MKKLFILLLLLFVGTSVLAIQPELLTEQQTKDYKVINETLEIIYNKAKPKIKTLKYPKFYHDFTLLKDDGTHNRSYYYVRNSDAELIYNKDSNELKYVTFRYPELQKCRIIYDYPSGNFHAVQIYTDDNKVFIFSPEGKYVDYDPYIKAVREKILKNWKQPDRKSVTILAKDKNSLLVQLAITVTRDGNVRKCQILKTSRIREVDNSAVNAVKASVPFEKFPENFFNEEIVIEMNFNFNL